MKILQVTPFFSPWHGGSAEVPYQLSRQMVERGHEVTVYTSDYKISQEYLDSAPEVKIRPFKTWLSWVKFYITPDMSKGLRESIAHFDVIHMHNFFTFQNIVTHDYARKYHVPYILQAHGSVATFFQKGILKRIFYSLWGHSMIKDASRLIAVTSVEAKQYQNMGADQDKVEIVPHGIAPSEFNDLPPRGKFRKEHGFEDKQKLILYLGRIDRLKGLDLLVKAFAGFSRELTDARLVIAGPDDGYLTPLTHLIEKLKIEEKVLFTGTLYGEAKLAAYVDADVYVLPSSYEIFGITVLEALACGTPVIVTDRCGVANHLKNNWGYTVPFDENQLKEALLKTLSGDRGFPKNNTRKFVMENFTWPKVAEQIENIYQSAIQTKV